METASQSAAPIWIDSLLQKQRAMRTNETCTLDELRDLLGLLVCGSATKQIRCKVMMLNLSAI